MCVCVCALDDHSRVRLQPQDGESGSDYINANYVDVSNTPTHTHTHTHTFKGRSETSWWLCFHDDGCHHSVLVAVYSVNKHAAVCVCVCVCTANFVSTFRTRTREQRLEPDPDWDQMTHIRLWYSSSRSTLARQRFIYIRHVLIQQQPDTVEMTHSRAAAEVLLGRRSGEASLQTRRQ